MLSYAGEHVVRVELTLPFETYKLTDKIFTIP